MEEIVFQPQYSWRSKLGLIVILVFAIGATIAALPNPLDDIEMTFVAVLFLSFSTRIPRTLAREFRFGDRITIQRVLLPPRTINYTEIVDVGGTGVKARRGGFAWIGFENGRELASIVEALVDKGIIPREQLEGKAMLTEASSYEALALALVPASVAPILLYWLGYYPDWIPPRLFVFVVFLMIYGLCYLVVRYRLGRKETV